MKQKLWVQNRSASVSSIETASVRLESMIKKLLLLVMSLSWAAGSVVGIACSDTSLTGPSASTTTQMLIQQLQDRGVAVSRGEVMPASSFPFFSARAQRLIVNGADVYVFEYPNASAAQKDAGQVAPLGSPIGTTQITWIGPPRFYRSSQLIVLYVGTDASIAAHLEAVLGAPFATGAANG